MVDSLHTIERCWEGSCLYFDGNDGFTAPAMADSERFVAAAVALTLIAAVVFLRRELTGVSMSFKSIFNIRRLHSVEENKYYESSCDITFFIAVPVLSLILFRSGLFTASFRVIFIVLASFCLLHWSLCRYVAWLRGFREPLLSVSRCARMAVTVVAVLLLPMAGACYLSPDISRDMIFWYNVSVAGAVYIIYLTRTCQILIPSGFSHLFWFLYLCALELIPLGTVLGVLMI